MSVKIIACVITYNRKEKLLKCMDALLKQTYKDFSIMVVDNNSTDGTYEAIRKYIDNNSIYYHNTHNNLGGAGGFNFAMKLVAKNYDYIWIMDDDTYPKATALEAFYIATNRLNGSFGFLSSLAEWINGEACLMNKQFLCTDIFSNIKILEYSLLPILQASFVSLFFPTRVIYQYGLPIKEFFLYGDDVEFTRRISHLGGYLVLNSVVIHDMNTNDGIDILTNDTVRMERYWLFVRNRIFIAKQARNIKEFVKAYLSGIKQMLRVIIYSKSYKFFRIKMIFKGMLLGCVFNPKIEFLDKSYRS